MGSALNDLFASWVSVANFGFILPDLNLQAFLSAVGRLEKFLIGSLQNNNQ